MEECKGLIERKAVIFNTQKYNVYDGPGIRTIIFFKGCPLRCKWCANPEGLQRTTQVMFNRDNCVDCGRCINVCPVGIHHFSKEMFRHEIDRSINCIGCRRCVDVCANRALQIFGEEKTISELLAIIKEDQVFYENSGGGVTLSGGEVLAQPEAATSILQACKQCGIHTAIETSGYSKTNVLLSMARFVDLFLFDIKQIDSQKHFYWTGVHNDQILENLQELLNRGFDVEVRMPLIHGANTDEQDIARTLQFLLPYRDMPNFHGVDLLPYHKMGVAKYRKLDISYAIDGDVKPSEEELSRIERQFLTKGFQVRILRH